MIPFAYWSSFNTSSGGGGGGGGGITCHTFQTTVGPWNASTARTSLKSQIDADGTLTADQKTAMKNAVDSYVDNTTRTAMVVYKTVSSVSYDITIENLPMDESATVSYPSACYP